VAFPIQTASGDVLPLAVVLFGGAELARIQAEAPTPTPEPEACTLTPKVEDLNLRGGPATRYDITGTLYYGTHANVLGRSEDGTWYYIEMDGVHYWVFGEIVALSCEPGALPRLDEEGQPSAQEVVTNTADLQFALSTNAPACESAPDLALVQSPAGARVSMVLNGATFEMDPATTLIVQANGGEMLVRVLSGGIRVKVGAETHSAIPGTQIRAAMQGGEVVGAQPMEKYVVAPPEEAPLDLLKMSVSVPEPADPTAAVLAMCNLYGIPSVTVAPDRPVALVWGWSASTRALLNEHLEAAAYTVTLNGAPLEDLESYRQEPVNGQGQVVVSWVVPVGSLEPGTHRVEWTLDLAAPIEDGFDADDNGQPDVYGPGITESGCTILVE
jgi:hypothetical protein